MRAYSRVVMFAMMVRVHVGLVSKLLTVMVMMLAYALTEALVFSVLVESPFRKLNLVLLFARLKLGNSSCSPYVHGCKHGIPQGIHTLHQNRVQMS